MGFEKYPSFELTDEQLLAKNEKLLSKKIECRCSQVIIEPSPIPIKEEMITDEKKKSKTAKRKPKKNDSRAK